MGGGREQVFQTQLEVRCADGYGVLPVLGRFLPSHQSPEKGLINPFIAQKHHPETPTQLLHTAAKKRSHFFWIQYLSSSYNVTRATSFKARQLYNEYWALHSHIAMKDESNLTSGHLGLA